jgi:hypothetical protein
MLFKNQVSGVAKFLIFFGVMTDRFRVAADGVLILEI